MKQGHPETIRTSRSADAQFLLLEQRFDSFEEDVQNKFNTLGGEINRLSAQIESWMQARRGQWREVWPVVVTAGAVLWFVLNQQISGANRNVDDKANRTQTQLDQLVGVVAKNTDAIPTLQQQAATSIQDRADKQKVLDKLADVVIELGKNQTALSSKTEAGFTEVETQIDSLSQMYNEKIAEIFRRLADAQNTFHEMGAKVPPAANGPFFFPNISNRNHRKQ